MSNKKEQLNNEELEEVTGGCGGAADENIKGPHGPEIDGKDMGSYVGKNVYAVDRGNNYALWGKVVKFTGGIDRCIIRIYVEDGARKGSFHHNGEESNFGDHLYHFFEKLD